MRSAEKPVRLVAVDSHQGPVLVRVIRYGLVTDFNGRSYLPDHIGSQIIGYRVMDFVDAEPAGNA